MNPSDTNWDNPQPPLMFARLNLKPKHKGSGPGIVTDQCLVIKAKPSSTRNVAALTLRDLIFYVRKAAIKDSQFRLELEDMVNRLPKNNDAKD